MKDWKLTWNKETKQFIQIGALIELNILIQIPPNSKTWFIMYIFNDLWCIFPNGIHIYVLIYLISMYDSFALITKPWTCVSQHIMYSLCTPTVPHFRVLTWITSGRLTMSKSVIRTICTYLTTYNVGFQQCTEICPNKLIKWFWKAFLELLCILLTDRWADRKCHIIIYPVWWAYKNAP